MDITEHLCASVRVAGMPVPKFDCNIEGQRLKRFLSQLASLSLCTGITDTDLQAFAKLPTGGNQRYYLHISHHFGSTQTHTSCIRSRECEGIAHGPICSKCIPIKKILLDIQRKSEENSDRPIHKNDPMHDVPLKAKKHIKSLRQEVKNLHTVMENDCHIR